MICLRRWPPYIGCPAIGVLATGVLLASCARSGAGTDAAEDPYRAYRSHGDVAALAAKLVQVSFFEGGAWLLVAHGTGDTTRVAGPPVVSPDGARFVATSLDLVAGHDPNLLEVWRVTEAGFEPEYTQRPTGWGPSDARWIGPDTVAFLRNVVDDRLTYTRTPMLLVRRDGAWWLAIDIPEDR